MLNLILFHKIVGTKLDVKIRHKYSNYVIISDDKGQYVGKIKVVASQSFATQYVSVNILKKDIYTGWICGSWDYIRLIIDRELNRFGMRFIK